MDQFESDNDGNTTENLTVNYNFSVENEIFKSMKEKAKIITEVTTENDQFILDSNQKCYEVKIEDELQPLELVIIFKFRAISRNFLKFILNFFSLGRKVMMILVMPSLKFQLNLSRRLPPKKSQNKKHHHQTLC